MTTEIKRDLHADLAICNAAQSGPWKISGGKFGEMNIYAGELRIVSDIDYDMEAEATFITEARTGWPIAIERAISAEEQVGALIELLREATNMIIPNESEYRCDYRRKYISDQLGKIVPEEADE